MNNETLDLHETIEIEIPENNIFTPASVKLSMDDGGLVVVVTTQAGGGQKQKHKLKFEIPKRPSVEDHEVVNIGLMLVNTFAFHHEACKRSPLTRADMRDLVLEHYGVCRNGDTLATVVSYLMGHYAAVDDGCGDGVRVVQ